MYKEKKEFTKIYRGMLYFAIVISILSIVLTLLDSPVVGLITVIVGIEITSSAMILLVQRQNYLIMVKLGCYNEDGTNDDDR